MTAISSLNEIRSVRDYFARIGAEPRSMKTAVVKEQRGRYWTDVAVIRFGSGGEVNASSPIHMPTEAEQAMISAEWANYRFPQLKTLSRLVDLPEELKAIDKQSLFEFRDVTGKQIIMLQARLERSGERRYVPWTYWDDNRWRMAEPEGRLPLWGLDQLRNHKTVFIHEGAKAARYCRWLAEGATEDARKARSVHPWGAELVGAAHLGWIGGALSPRRTDWSELARNGVERAYIVADNDAPGKSAISAISQELRIATFSIEFSGRFAPAFDLADEFPAEMFQTIGKQRFYVGPTLRDLTQPATWATDIVPNPAGKGRPINVLRESFGKLWAYVEEADAFVCTEMPEILRTEAIFNKMVAPFSHVNDTSRLLVRQYKGRSARVCYRPDIAARLVDHRGANAVNLHVPAPIRSAEGDAEPWLEFLRYIFVNPEERRQAERWCATLIAKPEIRMNYGLLLISERQGVGKTTLGSVVLAPLVGLQNVGYPSENDITSTFNDWVAQKRLAVVSEIYSGSSWKAYHALKSVITDQEVTVNQKYMRQYVIENWCHILACSNSMRALKMEQDDRRWFYPEITETPWPAAKFTAFRRWIQSGGLSIIRHWAEEFKDYVEPGERAPMTERKREMIEGSRSEAQRAAAALAEVLKERPEPCGLLMKDVVAWVKMTTQDRVFDTDYELSRAMVETGARKIGARVKVHGYLQYVIANDALFDKWQRAEGAAAGAEVVRASIIKPSALMEADL